MLAGKPNTIPTGRLWDYLEAIETQDASVVVDKIKKDLPKKKKDRQKVVQETDWERVEEDWKVAAELKDNPDPKAWLIKALLADIDSWHKTLQFWRWRKKPSENVVTKDNQQLNNWESVWYFINKIEASYFGKHNKPLQYRIDAPEDRINGRWWIDFFAVSDDGALKHVVGIYDRDEKGLLVYGSSDVSPGTEDHFTHQMEFVGSVDDVVAKIVGWLSAESLESSLSKKDG